MTKENRCKRCRRKLTNESSIKIGYGSVCFKKLIIEQEQYKTLDEF